MQAVMGDDAALWRRCRSQFPCCSPYATEVDSRLTQVLVQYLDYDLSLQDAIDAPRARLRNGTAVLTESRIGEAVSATLQGRGHDIEQPDAWSIRVGGMHGIAIEPATGVMTGGADSRRDGTAIAPTIPLRTVNNTKSLPNPDAAQQQ